MTIEFLNKLASSAAESKNTMPGEFLFFKSNSTASESLKKLSNHGFKIGYAFTIILNNNEYTKLVAYNKKNDIFRGWMGQVNSDNGSKNILFPLSLPGFACYLNMPRYNTEGKLKLYKENFNSGSRQIGYGTKMFGNLSHVEYVDDISLYGEFFPILEHPEIEQNRRLKIMNDQNNKMFYTDVASICNIYRFNETYELLDEGLQKIYKTLLDNRESKFCDEIAYSLDNENMLKAILKELNLDINDVKKIFENQGRQMPDFSIPKHQHHIKKSFVFNRLKSIIRSQK